MYDIYRIIIPLGARKCGIPLKFMKTSHLMCSNIATIDDAIELIFNQDNFDFIAEITGFEVVSNGNIQYSISIEDILIEQRKRKIDNFLNS
jgi:hypothetical protein